MNIDKLKSMIQAANDDIMKLQFGCEVSNDKGANSKVGTVIYKFADKHGNQGFTVSYGMGWDGPNEEDFYTGHQKVDRMGGYKILGRPIRLADVLLVIHQRRLDDKRFRRDIAIQDYGCFMELRDDDEGMDWYETFGGKRFHWNLKDDNLDHQSDETKQFLIDLLIQPS